MRYVSARARVLLATPSIYLRLKNSKEKVIMIKVLHVISDKNIGGAGRLLLNLLKEADREKFDISVALPNGSLLIPRIEMLRIKVFKLRGGTSSSEFSAIREMCQIIKKEKPHIVHTHSALFARIAAHACGVPVKLNTKHCSLEVSGNIGFTKKAATKIFDALFADHTIATAEYAKKRLVAEGIAPSKISVIINGSLPIKELTEGEKSAIRAQLGYTDSDFIAGMVARLERGKGQEIFIQAARLCQKDHPKIKFLIVGNGSLEDELKSSAHGLDNVKFLGFLPDVTEIMNILDANVNCSYISETSSLSLSEGMSVGAIPIVSDCGGNAFMAKDCGFVIPKKDSRALCEKLICLSSDPNQREKLKKASRERFFAQFTSKRMAKETENLYFELLKARRPIDKT